MVSVGSGRGFGVVLVGQVGGFLLERDLGVMMVVSGFMGSFFKGIVPTYTSPLLM